ncbi:hypothetical protein [Stappia sp.]|uniref:hypothetical protein n=1 Tax=Stappia sp. TaxID=1870903 RepID=UPI003D12A1DD
MYKDGNRLQVPHFEAVRGDVGSLLIETCFDLVVSGSLFGFASGSDTLPGRSLIEALRGVRPFKLRP